MEKGNEIPINRKNPRITRLQNESKKKGRKVEEKGKPFTARVKILAKNMDKTKTNAKTSVKTGNIYKRM